MESDEDSDGCLFDDSEKDSWDAFFDDSSGPFAALYAQLAPVAPQKEPMTPEVFAKLLVDEAPERLALGEKDLGDVGLAHLASALATVGEQKHVRVLNLEHNAVGNAGAISLSSVAGFLPQLDKLFVNDNNIGSEGIAGLIPALGQLEVLNLNNNPFGADGLAALGCQVADGAFARLNKLYISKGGCGDAGLVAFSRTLSGVASALPSLYELWLSNNQIGNEGATAFFDVLGKGAMPGLGDLRIQYNQIGNAGIAALINASASGAFGNLWYLGLSDNAFTDEGLKALEGVIGARGLPRLEFITASSDQSTAVARQSVQDMLSRRRAQTAVPKKPIVLGSPAK